ncbi:glycosyltransferase [uncultured Desulfosarcina sp.]|uniref:glycosyltransferase family 2 protein n=1 Tax=uncultured Desulfosarcina sp. TaxID=218289 RepID=UPI0029C65189|nr:glycosyltransferase [uncultured Desulfosarcina sp.]
MEILIAAWEQFLLLLTSPFRNGLLPFVLKFIPYVIFLELPVYFFILAGVLKWDLRRQATEPKEPPYYPRVSCIVMGYGEGRDIALSILSLAEQVYAGHVEILALIDGARKNVETYQAARQLQARVDQLPRRTLRIVPKWQRGGRVSSLNAGMELATGEMVMNIDGDTSFDNDMVAKVARHFSDPNVVGVAGNLRVRNVFASLTSRLQAVEYMLSIHLSKIGLSEFNVINNISGAFGVYRKSFLQKIGGWDSGTAEDLDLTIRSKQYFGRHPELRLVFEPEAIGHTEVPDTFRGLLDQRLRWDGDLYYLYIRKHPLSFSPRILGWRNMTLMLWTGLFFQIVMPLVIIIYTAYSLAAFPIDIVLALWALIYLLYLAIMVVLFTTYVTLVSERKRQDLKLLPVIPLVPVFTFALRLWNALATLKEVAMRSHLDSSMAPWWVLKRTKF